MPDIHQLIERLWSDYAEINPQARKINDLLKSRGLAVFNDHIAFRTYDNPKINIDALSKPFVAKGYEPKDSYEFSEKHLTACHFEHKDTSLPKVFISQLILADFPSEVGKIVGGLVEQISDDFTRRWDWPIAGRPWKLSFTDYQALGVHSEYAAWLSAFGFRANHFTIDVGLLDSMNSLSEFNAFVEDNGFELNTSGGRIKGSPQVFLEQSSTLASKVPVRFTDGTHTIPGCYYEFAKRYELPDGNRFEGFVAKSADKIFESTDRQKD